ncbi:MAG: CDC48 family AAA ATPase [Candidatus Woesearchaeota archaeon]
MPVAKSIKLKVAESIQDDVNKGIVRIDSSFMREIDIRPGSIVEIKGERTSVGIVDRSLPGDIGLNIIRMDGLARRNTRTSVGEMVEVKKAEVIEAKRIVLAPDRKGIMIRANPGIFKQGLLGRAVMKGDRVALGGARRRRTTMQGSPFPDDMFNMLDEAMMGFGLGDLKFVVLDTLPKQPVMITDNTEIVYKPEAVTEEEEVEGSIDIRYEDVGGLDEELKKVREMVELPLKHPEIFERLGIEPPKGVLFHGPPGTGKTLLAKAVATETKSNFSLINGPEIMSKYYGQSEENLRKKFEDAEKGAPSIIFIDEIDAIASKREESKGEVERRVVAQLLALMDGLKSRGKVVVIAATNIPNSLDPALRRPGRFDREIEIGVPRVEGRVKILKIHTRNMPMFTLRHAVLEQKTDGMKNALMDLIDHLDMSDIKSANVEKAINKYLADHPEKNKEYKDLDVDALKKALKDAYSDRRIVNLDELASVTHGFVGADLSALAKEAAMIVLRRVFPDLKLEEEEAIKPEVLEKLHITMNDFKDALKVVRPSAMREVLVEVPNVKWSDVGGLEELKQELLEAVEWPLKNKEAFRRLGVKPPKGVLLYGPPGTGKTMLAKAVATESEANFISVKGPEMLSKWVGESEKAVRKVFEKARQTAPTIIFFDELDSIAHRRGSGDDNNVTERVVNQLLTEMDGLQELNDIVILAASNRPDIIDTALLRPGRFDRIVHVAAPEMGSRIKIFEVHTKKMPVLWSSVPKDYTIDRTKFEAMKKMASDHVVSAKELEHKAPSKTNANMTDKEKFLFYLAEKTEGYVGADIEAVCREAAILSLREDMDRKDIPLSFFEKALEKVRPSINKEIEESYKQLEGQFRMARGKQMAEERPAYYG